MARVTSASSGIHKHADAQHERRQRAGNFHGRRERDVPRALFIKHQPDHVRAGLGGHQRIGHAGDAADFYLRFHLRFTIFNLRLPRLERLPVNRKS